MDIKEPLEGETSIQALVYSTGSTTGEIYHYSPSGQWNRSYQYAGIPSDIGMASLENGGDISGQSINFANIIDIGKFQSELASSIYDMLGLNYINMTSADKDMANLGICIGIVDSVFLGDAHSATSLVKSAVKSGIFYLVKKNETQCDVSYYYLKAKVQTEYTIYIASTIAMYGSFAAAATTLAAAGVSAMSGGTAFLSSAGTGLPVTIVCEGAAVYLAEASGVCFLAGVAMAGVSNTSKAAFDRDIIKLASTQISGIAINEQDAIRARDAALADIATWSNTKRDDVTTVAAGYNKKTGRVAVGINKTSVYHGTLCAEDLVVEQLGGINNINDIIMTPAIRPRTGQIIPVCKRCQAKYPKSSFMPGTPFE